MPKHYKFAYDSISALHLKNAELEKRIKQLEGRIPHPPSTFGLFGISDVTAPDNNSVVKFNTSPFGSFYKDSPDLPFITTDGAGSVNASGDTILLALKSGVLHMDWVASIHPSIDLGGESTGFSFDFGGDQSLAVVEQFVYQNYIALDEAGIGGPYDESTVLTGSSVYAIDVPVPGLKGGAKVIGSASTYNAWAFDITFALNIIGHFHHAPSRKPQGVT